MREAERDAAAPAASETRTDRSASAASGKAACTPARLAGQRPVQAATLIAGKEGKTRLGAGTGKIAPDTRAASRSSRRASLDRAPTTGGWGREVTEVVKAMRAGSDMDCNIDAGGAALAVALAAYESSRTGRRIAVAGR